MFAKIFASIERTRELIKYYHKCQKDTILKNWRNQLELEQDSFTQLIHNFYDILISNWHTQNKWLNSVFPSENSSNILLDIYIDSITNLDPSMEECINAALKQTNDKLSFLQEIKQTMQQFAKNLGALADIKTKSKDNKHILPLLEAVYRPFATYVSKYSSFEQKHLIQKLSEFNFVKDELTDTIQALNLSIPTIMDIAREAKKRCEDITENCGYCGLLTALRGFFLNYADHFRVVQRQIARIKVSGEDWGTFQLCLSLLQSTGDILVNLQKLESDLTASVLEFNKLPNVQEYKSLFLTTPDKKEFDSLVKCVTDGTQLSLLDHVSSEFNKLCSDIHNTTYQVVFSPISKQLDAVQSAKVWAQINESNLNSELPDYSFSPQEYITQIGLYLMTLPQHLEPFLFRENPSLSCALKAADSEYNEVTDIEGAMADVFLGIVARGTCQGYCDRILSICELGPSACRQLAHDISKKSLRIAKINFS